MAEHRIKLVQLAARAGNFFHRHADFAREIELLLLFVRKKFVQRRIEKTNRRRQARRAPENSDEILALIREQLGERLDPRLLILGQDHLAHRVDPVPLEKHVFGAAKADPLRAESDGVLRPARGCRRWSAPRAFARDRPRS